MHRLNELFSTSKDIEPPEHMNPVREASLKRVIVIESRVMAGDLFCYAFRQALPTLKVDLVARLDDVGEDPAVLFYSFINRGCDFPAIEKALSRFKERYPGFPLVVVTDTAGEEIEGIMAQHASAKWLPSSAGFNAVVAAVREATESGLPGAPRDATVPPAPDHQVPYKAKTMPLGLTTKEHAIIRYLHEGKSNKVIAHALDCSESTVKVHIANMMRKLRLHNRTQLALVYQGEGHAAFERRTH